MRDLLLTLHLIGVAAWLGGNLTQLMVMPILERAGHVAGAAWHEASGQMARIYYSIAGAVITATGVGLVLDGPYAFSDPFVSVGFAVVIIGAVIGVKFFAPASRAAVAAHKAADDTALTGLRSRSRIGGAFDTALVVFAIYAMVSKLGI